MAGCPTGARSLCFDCDVSAAVYVDHRQLGSGVTGVEQRACPDAAGRWHCVCSNISDVAVNFDAILKSSFNHGVSIGKEAVVTDNRNPERRSGTNTVKGSNLDVLGQMRKQKIDKKK